MFRPTCLAIAVSLLATAACSSAPPLANSHPSAEALATAVLAALAAKDLPALEALALDDREFRNHVWPELPAARPERNLPYSYVWGELNQKSRIALSEVLAGHGGMHDQLHKVTFAGATRYPSYTVHREATLHITDASGEQREIRVCGSMLEKDGVWKVFSYVVDD
jgi:hypothetical protein